jgi:hypothetical protein
MSVSSRTTLAARFELIPSLRVGPLWFGGAVEDHRELLHRVEVDSELDGDLVEYAVPGLEDALSVHVDGEGRIDTVTFYAFCQLRGRDLIGMGIGELLVALGEAPDDIEPDMLGGELELIYAFASLGLLVWTSDGIVTAVQACGASF